MNPFRQLKRYLIYKFKPKIEIDSLLLDFNNLNINEIFRYFGCNKATELEKDKVIDHGKLGFNYRSWLFGKSKENKTMGQGYSEFYEKHLKLFKNKKINILEIGSFAGASAASFVKYCPSAIIYCLDINLTNFKFISKNIKVFGLDVSQKSMISKFYKKIKISNETQYFDIIIDDGSHKLSDIIISLNTFFKNLRAGGLYILEDFKFPNYHPHLDDCSEKKIDEILNYIKNKKKFSSNILTDETILYILNFTEEVFQYRGLKKNSDIAFIKKLN